MKNLGIFYRFQANAWNTGQLWALTVRSFNKDSELEVCTIATVMDNNSANAIDYSPYGNYEAIFLPPNLTSVLQPVNAAFGVSFRCAFRRRLIDHLMQYVTKNV